MPQNEKPNGSGAVEVEPVIVIKITYWPMKGAVNVEGAPNDMVAAFGILDAAKFILTKNKMIEEVAKGERIVQAFPRIVPAR